MILKLFFMQKIASRGFRPGFARSRSRRPARFRRQPRSFVASGFGRGGHGQPRRSCRRQKLFDPSLLVSKTSARRAETYQAKHIFADFALCAQLQKNIQARGFTEPTPIQDQVIPLLLANKDVIGLANTGTGKTAAFLIPLINKVYQRRSEKVLIVAPTRELVVQIEEELRAFSQRIHFFSAVCIGGVPLGRQISALSRRPSFVIGTPGRLLDLSQRGALRFSDYTSIVLDEVDRMLDMGFIHDVSRIIAALPRQRHSLFFSATLPEKMQGIVRDFLKEPVCVSIKAGQVPINVDQNIVKVNGRGKVDLLHKLLIQKGFDKVLVFGRTKWGIERLAKELIQRGFRAASIHGNKTQSQRQRALEQFRASQIQVLLATDVASRGLDINNVTHVINFDLPGSYEDYLHRIGRTGRMDKKGTALSFVD